MVQTQEENDLQLVEQFFAARGLKAERIPETTTKSTDFKILKGSDVVAFCEVKSPQDVFVERVEYAIRRVPPGQVGGIIEHGASSRQYRCIERAATKAAEQFNAVNPSRQAPNVLMIVNHDTVSYESDFVEAVTGYVDGLGYGPTSLRVSIPKIDAYIWLDQFASRPRMLWQQNQFMNIIIDLLKAD